MNLEEEIVKSLKESSEDIKILKKDATSAGCGDDILDSMEDYMKSLDKLQHIFDGETE